MRNFASFPSQTSSDSLPNISLANLKLCPLCDSLNARGNCSCFVCGWEGRFVHDPRKIRTSLVILLEQCPDLAESIRIEPQKKKLTSRQVWTLFKRVFLSRGKLDLTV